MTEWTCPACDHANTSTNFVCSNCNIPLSVSARKVPDAAKAVAQPGNIFLEFYIRTLYLIGCISLVVGITILTPYSLLYGAIGMIVSIGTAKWIELSLETNKLVRSIISKN